MKRVLILAALVCGGGWCSTASAQWMNDDWWAYQQRMMLREQMQREIQWSQQQANYPNTWNRGYHDDYYRTPAGSLVRRNQVPSGGFNNGYRYAGSYGPGHMAPRGR